jgi:alpha-mannosidase
MTPVVSPSDTKLISETIVELRSCCQIDVLSSWLYSENHREITENITVNLSDWQPIQLNPQVQIPWKGGKNVLWLGQKFVVPQNLQGYLLAGLSLRLALVWWADAVQVYVNGELVLEGDLFDSSPRVLLSQGVTPGEEFTVVLRLVSPGHCDGALMRSRLIYESIDYNSPDPGFVADELAIVQLYLQNFAPQKLADLAAGVKAVKNSEPKNQTDWNNLLLFLRQKLTQSQIANLKSKIYLLGHAHLDLAWLWPVSETWNVAQKTFASALKLQADFPELIFSHSTPALYAWIETHRPDLFSQIQQQVAAGRWEVIGGFWVEPELNLIAGESIVRQLLYGQRYFQDKFGKISPVVWVPDSFGFCATLPQFLVNAGIEFFVTQKLRWNDTTKFDYGAFWWRSPDGSEIFSFMSAPIGESIDPVKMATYACEWQQQTGLADALWLPGIGDHGGGPTRDMLEIAQRWQHSPVFPQLEFITAENYLQQIKPQLPHLPIWENELYLEFHRGCYTSHADQKRWNRSCENLLYQAELFATLATVISGLKYPKTEIETAWKQVLFQQFHDILPGSSITQVYQDGLKEWQQVEQTGTKILQDSLLAISAYITLPEPPEPDSLPVIVFNSLNWERSEVVTIHLPATANPAGKIYDTSGSQLPSQLTTPSTLIFRATNIPPVGYSIFWLSPTPANLPNPPQANNWILENEYLRVVVNHETGNLASVFDKTQQREILSSPGNQLQAFQDSGQYWDAWNIDPNYSQHPLPATQLKSIQWREQGPVQSCIRVVLQFGKSEFCQDYILSAGSPLLKITTTVNWQENQVLLKTAFPFNITAEFATYEIPCGTIRRPTKPQTPAEQAKWEVPALRWADLTAETPQGIYGISLLNDCKYGYDAQPNQLRLTLLRSPNWPDPEADRGDHAFTYALYPHAGSWETAHTVHRGYELNIPLQVLVNPPNLQHPAARKLTGTSFLDLSAENLILMALKPAEAHPEKLILRCYECHGETAGLCLQSDLGFSLGNTVDLLESSPGLQPSDTTIQPWKIASFELIPENNSGS